MFSEVCMHSLSALLVSWPQQLLQVHSAPELQLVYSAEEVEARKEAARAATAASAVHQLDISSRHVLAEALAACPSGVGAQQKGALAAQLNDLRRWAAFCRHVLIDLLSRCGRLFGGSLHVKHCVQPAQLCTCMCPLFSSGTGSQLRMHSCSWRALQVNAESVQAVHSPAAHRHRCCTGAECL